MFSTGDAIPERCLEVIESRFRRLGCSCARWGWRPSGEGIRVRVVEFGVLCFVGGPISFDGSQTGSDLRRRAGFEPMLVNTKYTRRTTETQLTSWSWEVTDSQMRHGDQSWIDANETRLDASVAMKMTTRSRVAPTITHPPPLIL